MAHSHTHSQNESRTFFAALITGIFLLVEVVGALLASSLALLADAGHMLTDFASLGFAWAAFRLARRPPDDDRSFGLHRFQVLVAFANGLTLFFICAWITVEAIARLREPVEVLAGPMLVVAVAGLLVNIIAFVLLHGADRQNLNIRGAMLHVVGDLLGSTAAIVAAAIILTTGWYVADPILSLLVVAILLVSAWRVTRDSGHILLEGTPPHIDIAELKRDLVESIPAVLGIHHVHAWSLTQERPMITLHAKLRDQSDGTAACVAIKQRLADRFGIDHATVETETELCADTRVDRVA